MLVHNKALYSPYNSPIDNVVSETLNGSGNFTSKFTLSADDALDAGMDFLGPNYRELGKPGSGVFRSNDMIDGYYRQFRIDSGSLSGAHEPGIPHVHLELFKTEKAKKAIMNNHIPYEN